METKSLTNTLLEKWNTQEKKDYGINPEELWFSKRREMEYEVREIRTNQLSDYAKSYSASPEQLAKDEETIKAYRSIFSWDETYSIESTWNIQPDDYFRTRLECEDINEAKEYLANDYDKEIEEPEAYDYDGGMYIDGEDDRTLVVHIQNLKLKENIDKSVIEEKQVKKVRVILSIEKSDDEIRDGQEDTFASVAEDVMDLINSKVPYLKVVKAEEDDQLFIDW